GPLCGEEKQSRRCSSCEQRRPSLLSPASPSGPLRYALGIAQHQGLVSLLDLARDQRLASSDLDFGAQHLNLVALGKGEPLRGDVGRGTGVNIHLPCFGSQPQVSAVPAVLP